MVKLRFKIKGTEIECEGTVEEIGKIISGFIGGNFEVLGLGEEEINLKEKIPTQETLVNYIVSKPNFEHNIFESLVLWWKNIFSGENLVLMELMRKNIMLFTEDW